MKIIVVGGGYAGCALAKSLDEEMDVTLIDEKEAFVHSAAMIRGLVDLRTFESAIMPYANLLTQGRVVKGKVVHLIPGGVQLESGQSLLADAVVVATGSSYASPFKATGETLKSFRERHQGTFAHLEKAQTVSIVGAGAVGIELAGEIAVARPDKRIHLVSEQSTFFPGYTAKFHAKLHKKLTALGVEVHLECRAENLSSVRQPSSGTIELSNGSLLESDIVIPAVGSWPNAELLRALPDVRFDNLGRAKVDKYMRPSSSMPNLFAMGDVSSQSDGMTIVAITRQGPWLADALRQLNAESSLGRVRSYLPWRVAPVIVPLGEREGASVLPYGPNGYAVGAWLTSTIKGKRLFIPKYRKLLGLRGLRSAI